MSLTTFRKAKQKAVVINWNCKYCSFVSTSRKQAELHLKMSHKVKDCKIKDLSKEEMKKLQNTGGFCSSCHKSMQLHSKMNGNCP